MQWYDIHYLLDGVYFYSNPYGYIFILEDNHVFFNTYDPYSIKNFGRVPIEFFDDLAHSEEYIMVLGVIFIFLKTYELSNSIKPLMYHYYNNKGGGCKRCISPSHKRNHKCCIRGEEKLGSKGPNSHKIHPLSTTYILCGLVTHLNQAKNVHNNN